MSQTLTNTLAEIRILTTELNMHNGEIHHLTMRRRVAINKARAAGAMLEEIAQAAGISRQRVHVITDEGNGR